MYGSLCNAYWQTTDILTFEKPDYYCFPGYTLDSYIVLIRFTDGSLGVKTEPIQAHAVGKNRGVEFTMERTEKGSVLTGGNPADLTFGLYMRCHDVIGFCMNYELDDLKDLLQCEMAKDEVESWQNRSKFNPPMPRPPPPCLHPPVSCLKFSSLINLPTNDI